MKNLFIIIVQGVLFSSVAFGNDTTIVNMIFRLCDNQKSMVFPFFDKENLTYSFHPSQDTLTCKLVPVIKKISNGGATIEEGIRIRLFKKYKEYIQTLSVPEIDINNAMFIVVVYKDYRYVFKREISQDNVFEMCCANDKRKSKRNK